MLWKINLALDVLLKIINFRSYCCCCFGTFPGIYNTSHPLHHDDGKEFVNQIIANLKTLWNECYAIPRISWKSQRWCPRDVGCLDDCESGCWPVGIASYCSMTINDKTTAVSAPVLTHSLMDKLHALDCQAF